eukprot:TRINITY_DN8291_c0_g4_i1.p3 TRINITY_DN8291_c0_g4~~TRINITY_DN8291_c0_g4_i1.p3  ORF type:complete len:188 (-),score=5.56 TRINITY_DN8291_c0_g4_i1:197-760(-)
MLWQEMPNVFNHVYVFQPTMISHAILAHWGANVRLILGDIDEFISTPKPYNSIHDMVNECKIGPMAKVQRIEYRCKSCTSDFQRTIWMQDINTSSPLQYYKVANLKNAKYEYKNPKGFVDPDKVCTWAVHKGIPLKQDDKFQIISPECLHLSHLRQLFRNRIQNKSNKQRKQINKNRVVVYIQNDKS